MVVLPRDIFDYIIDGLQDDSLALKLCALVCRSWAHRSRTHLFSRVTIPYIDHSLPFADVSVWTPAINSFLEQVSADIRMVDFLEYYFYYALSGPKISARQEEKARGRATQLSSLFLSNPKLADYVRTVKAIARARVGSAATRWTHPVPTSSQLHLARFAYLRSLTLTHFAFESFVDLIPTIQTIATLETLRCEAAQLLPPPFLPVEPAETYHPETTSSGLVFSLKTVSLSVGYHLATAVVIQSDTDALTRAEYSGRAFLYSGLLQSVTSFELFDTSTVLGWLPVLEVLGPQLHHVGVMLHDVHLSNTDVYDQFNVIPSNRDTIVQVYDTLRSCHSLRTLTICYDAEDTLSARLVAMWTPSTKASQGPLISSYFFEETVRLFSAASQHSGTASSAPFPELQQLRLKLIATAESLRDCAPACAALAMVLTSGDYPVFSRLIVEVEEFGGVFESDNAATLMRKAVALRSGIFHPFEEAGIALDVIVRMRPE